MQQSVFSKTSVKASTILNINFIEKTEACAHGSLTHTILRMHIGSRLKYVNVHYGMEGKKFISRHSHIFLPSKLSNN